MQTRAKYLVIIDAGGSMVALLFDAQRHQVAEFDAATEEVAVMTAGLVPAREGGATEWNQALFGHSALERAAASVYTLDV
jgi:hypothetical protein